MACYTASSIDGLSVSDLAILRENAGISGKVFDFTVITAVIICANYTMKTSWSRINYIFIASLAICASSMSICIVAMTFPEFELNEVQWNAHAQPGAPVDPTPFSLAPVLSEEIHEVTTSQSRIGICINVGAAWSKFSNLSQGVTCWAWILILLNQ